MKLLFYKIRSYVLIKFIEYKNRLFSILLCIGLLCFVLAVATSEQPIHNSVMEEEVPYIQDTVVSSAEIEPAVVDTVSETNSDEIEYGYLFSDLGTHIDTNNTLVTYTSVPLQDEHNQPLLVMSGKQSKNQMFSVSTNNLKFSLYNLDNTLYATVENDTNAKLYKVDTTLETDAYWNMLYSDTSNLAALLNNFEYDELEYAGVAYLDNRKYVKMVAEQYKEELIDTTENETDAFDSVFAIKPAIEITEVALEPEEETVEENSISEENAIDKFTSLDSFNVLTEPGHFVFYFDNTGYKLKKVYVRNENSITTISIDALYSIKLPDTVKVEQAELIEDDRLGRLMLSSIFAMVSDTELNELSKGLD